MTIGAFFDVDGTLFRDSLMIEHFKKLLKYEVFDPIVWHTNVKASYDEWVRREGNYDNYMEELADVYIDSLTGLNLNEYDFIAKQVINLCGDKVYSYTRDRINYHKEQGHKILFISGSPDYLVEKMAEKYGADDFRASKYIRDENNIFTGEVIPMWDSDSKTKSLIKLKDKYQIDLEQSYAYGDTHGDLSMLQLTGNPIAINPTLELVKAIKSHEDLKEKTRIIIERKNVLYNIPTDIEILNKK